MIDPILQHPNILLRTPCLPVTRFGLPVFELADRLFASLRAGPPAYGIAAPQIGILDRVIALDPSAKGHERLVMVNPVIVRSEGTQRVNDGCTSVQRGKLFRNRTRAARIRVEYQDEDGNPHKLKAQSHFAAIIQHEVDHLDGVLFIDAPGRELL